jgi:hypothetical protein
MVNTPDPAERNSTDRRMRDYLSKSYIGDIACPFSIGCDDFHIGLDRAGGCQENFIQHVGHTLVQHSNALTAFWFLLRPSTYANIQSMRRGMFLAQYKNHT